jgi:translocation and assembly module TamB
VNEPSLSPRPRKVWRYLLVAMLLGVLGLAGFVWYSTTDAFQAMVRRRLVTELELITGGRVQLGSFHSTPFRLRVDVRDLTIHGLEKSGEVPYAHVDRVVAQVKVISVLGAEFGVSTLELEHPVVHVIFYADGTTNQPVPKVERISGKNAIEELFDLSIGELTVKGGELVWNEKSIPLDFAANDVSAGLTYSLLHHHYTGDLKLGKVNTQVQGCRPFAWAAETHFVLTPNAVEVETLKATSGRSRLEATGRVDDFRNPRFQGKYITDLDLGEVAAIVRRRDLRAGTLQANGQGNWSAKDFSSAGKFQLKDIDLHDAQVDLRRAGLTAQYAVDEKKIALMGIQARLLGGSATGEASVENWLSSPDKAVKAGKNKVAAEQKGSIRLRVRDVSAGEMLAAIAPPAMPLSHVNVVGSTSGTVESSWIRSWKKAETVLALEVAPPRQSAPNQLPLTLHARATYRAGPGELEVSELDAATRATQLHASGLLSSSAALKFAISTTDLREWQPVLSTFGTRSALPLALHGHATFSGTATGRFPDVTVTGPLQAHDFDVLLPPLPEAPNRQVHCDSLNADLQVSRHAFSAHNGTLHRGDVLINFDLTADLQDGQFSDTSSFQARVDLHNADASEILALSGYNYPVFGVADLSLRARGTRGDPHGTGRLQLTGATVYGHSVEHFDSDLRFSGNAIELSRIHLSHDEARVTGEADYNFSSKAFRIDLAGKNFDLKRIPQLESTRVQVDGSLDFTATGSGTADEPSINATLHVRDLAFDHERAGNFAIDAVTRGADLHLNGRSDFEHAELDVDGDVHLRENWPSNVNLHFNHLDVDSLLRTYLQGTVTGHSAVAGDIHLEGPLRTPKNLNVTANLTDLFADIQNIKIRNDGPVRFTASTDMLKIERFRLIGEGTDISAGGSVQLTDQRELNLHAEGRLNLMLIQTLDPDFTSSGGVTVDLGVAGNVTRPVMQGRVQISNGAIGYVDLPSSLSEINGSLVFNQDRLQIESLTARTGGGLVQFGGYATTYNQQINFDLTASGQNVRLRYPAGVSSTATADLHWTGSNTGSTLEGDVTVTKLAVTPGFDFAAYMARATQTTALAQTNPLLNRIRMDVHIVTTPELQMQTAIARLSGDADLHLRGTAAKPVLLGRADVIEGDIYFNGSKYRMERGEVTFTSPVTTTPNLDLQASTSVRDYDITVNLNGTPDKLKMNWRSEPPLPEADIIALLALGRTQEESAQLQNSGQSQFTQQASNALLAEALNATVSNRVQRLFGVSRIKVDPQGLSTETNPSRGPQVTIEQQVANNLTLTYSTNVSQASQQIIQVEYNVTRNVSVIGIRDQNGVVSFDVRIRQRKK